MVPSRSTRSSSRRSSILKPPKPRQPLQNLNFNSSSNESSPVTTTKLKRRVSFAEKKHVKEFCNSLEQGTVWDNTYEEHDLSHLKLPCTSNEIECNIENVSKETIQNIDFHNKLCINTEVISEHNFEGNSTQFSSNQMIQEDLHIKNLNSSNEFNVIVYEDFDENVPNNCSKLNVTSVQDTDIDFTEMICNTVYSEAKNIENNELQETFKNISMELTQAIPTSTNILGTINTLQQEQEIEKFNSQYSLDKFNEIETKEIHQNISMELTVPILSTIKAICNVDDAEEMYCMDNRTKTFNDISMEITAVVPTIPCNLQQQNINYEEDCNTNLVSCDSDERTISHDISMEITKPVKASTFKNITSQDRTLNTSSVIKKISQYKCDTTCIDEKTMEMTRVIPINIHSLPKRQEINAMNCKTTTLENNFEKLGYVDCETSMKFNKTVCDDKAMDFTTALTTLEIHSDNLKSDKSVQNTSHTQRNPHNTVLNKTVFHNNSITTTAIVSSLNMRSAYEEEMMDCKSNTKKQKLDKTVLLPNISMEITEVVTSLQSHSEVEDIVIDTTEVMESILSKQFEDRNFHMNFSSQTTVPNNISKDITNIGSSSINLNAFLDEQTSTIDNPRNLEDNFDKKLIPNEVQNSVNIKTSMALHDLMEQDTCALASKENNTETASALLNFASNDCIPIVTSELNQNECLQCEYSQDVVSHIRRTYTLKAPSTSHSIINSNNKNSKISGTYNNTLCYKINDKENYMYPVLNIIDISQNKEDNDEQSSKEKSITFSNENFEELESIKPPSFISLDDSSHEETNTELNCSKETVKSKNVEHEGIQFNYQNCSLIQDNQTNILEEDRSKLQTLLSKHISLNEEPDKSEVELEDQIQITEVQKIQLSDLNNTNTEIQVLECSSSTVNDTNQFPVSDDVEMQITCTDKSNVEDQNMECSSSKLNINENTPTHNKGHLPDAKFKLSNGQDLLSATNVELRRSSTSFVSYAENDVDLDSFSLLIKELKIHAQSDEIIWDIYHEDIEKKLFIVGFISFSLLIVIYLKDDSNTTNVQFIKEIKIISRLADDANALISIVHRLILEKLDITRMMDMYETSKDVLTMLDYISNEIILAMDFMFDVKRLDDLNLMEITRDSISFVSRTKRMDIILKITMTIKPFYKIGPPDVSVHCILGSVREDDIKQLIINIKRDHKFLRRYMNDVRDYIYLMEESNNMIQKSY